MLQKHQASIVVLLIVCLSLVFGCSGMQLAGPDDSEELARDKAYMAARKEFALTLQKYNDYYDKASPETQAEWKEKIDPLFKSVDKALKGWKLALDNDWGDAGQEQKYMDLKANLLILLVDVFGVED